MTTVRETVFHGPCSIEQLGWIGGMLLGVLAWLTIRDFFVAKKRWVVPFLFLFRAVTFAGVLLALAAPVDVSKKIFESGKNSIGIYLDYSASMRLRDPFDGKGRLVRWSLSASENFGASSPLAAADQSIAGLEVARALLIQDVQPNENPNPSLVALLEGQLGKARKVFTENRENFPYPDLVEEVVEFIESAQKMTKTLSKEDSGQSFLSRWDPLQLALDGATRRMDVVARELARREEAKAAQKVRETSPRQRLKWATDLLQKIEREILPPLESNLTVSRFQFAGKIEAASDQWDLPEYDTESPPFDLPASSANTDLNGALNQISDLYGGGQIGAAILLTDAVANHPGAKPVKVPEELRDFPLLLVPMGGDFQLNDIALWKVSAPKNVSRGDFISVECLVGGRGFEGKTTRVRLLKDGEELDAAEVSFSSREDDQSVRLTAPLKSTGTHRFEVSVSPLDGELQTDNNREYIEVSVLESDLNLLLIDGWPRWETRYLSNLLKRDESMEHREILLAPVPSAPPEELYSWPGRLGNIQIVVLGEVGPDFLGPGEIVTLENFVNGGGNLIVLAGREFMPAAFRNTPLANLLPVRIDLPRPALAGQFFLAPSIDGERIAALNLEDDPERNKSVWRIGSEKLALSGLSPFNIPKPGSQVILEAKTTNQENDNPAQKNQGSQALPYLTWHRYGAGRVFYFSAPSTYQLRYRYGDRYHYRFWGQFFRWVTTAEMKSAGGLIRLTTDKKRYLVGDNPEVLIEIKDEMGEPVSAVEPELILEQIGVGRTRHSCKEIEGKPGFYRTELPQTGHGEYRLTAGGKTIERLISEFSTGEEDRSNFALESTIVVESPPNAEDGDRTCDWETLQFMAENTAGAVIAPDAMATAIEVLAAKDSTDRREEVTETPLWDRWSLFSLILIFLAGEWAGRKYAGLI